MKLFDNFEIIPTEVNFSENVILEIKNMLCDRSVGEVELPLEFVDRLEVEFNDGTIVVLKEELTMPYPSSEGTHLNEITRIGYNKHIKCARLYIHTQLMDLYIATRIEDMLSVLRET